MANKKKQADKEIQDILTEQEYVKLKEANNNKGGHYLKYCGIEHTTPVNEAIRTLKNIIERLGEIMSTFYTVKNGRADSNKGCLSGHQFYESICKRDYDLLEKFMGTIGKSTVDDFWYNTKSNKLSMKIRDLKEVLELLEGRNNSVDKTNIILILD